jgi:serpin B
MPEAVFTPASDEELRVLSRANDFGFALYQQLRAQPGNIVVSPASVHIALGMTYAGARGETATEMARVLRVEGSSDSLHRAYGTALRAWNDTSAATLRVANRIYAERTAPLEPGFIALTRDIYSAPIAPVDFIHAPEPAREEINRWVAERTQDRIRDLLPAGSILSLTRLVLANAVYFKGTWQTQFDSNRTNPDTFYLESGGTPSVLMMNARARFAWARHRDGVRILEMPYAGGELSMVWLLPEARDGLAELERNLSSESLERWRGALREVEVEVKLPRFRLEPPTIALSDSLKAMGMNRAFDPHADFTGIANLPDGLYVSEVFHKAFIEVNEEGTEAAAATAVVMMTRGAPPAAAPEPPRFIADHPFLFALMDRRTGSVLFLGRVTDPR